ncbi:hypothetical protein OROGR_001832 [Orobanche gracilis]
MQSINHHLTTTIVSFPPNNRFANPNSSLRLDAKLRRDLGVVLSYEHKRSRPLNIPLIAQQSRFQVRSDAKCCRSFDFGFTPLFYEHKRSRPLNIPLISEQSRFQP